jgi:hypothetical protein
VDGSWSRTEDYAYDRGCCGSFICRLSSGERLRATGTRTLHIANVPGILMKQSEQARGTELAGLAVKVMNGYFVIGLSADDSEVQRNEQLLKDSSWFDIPIVYTNGMRAILAMEKGSRGDRTFAEAFSAWEKK